ncbi:unnamed protein product [Peniophora sp. CBMAI 1063]|nr:unnamed protein product [Peniophora sp. CBMAI 1063]
MREVRYLFQSSSVAAKRVENTAPEQVTRSKSTSFDAALPTEDGKPAPPAIRALGDARYARKCNLVTGEERREVTGANLFACTVDMCDMRTLRDIAIVDEIQMIADRDRGAAWTSAVLGVPAREVRGLHLWGEEASVPVVQGLMRETGDELVVNRYEWASPLRVADEVLGDLSKVQKGDCAVAFSRSHIFAAKQEIEYRTKLRCAVAYGRQPSEVRSEQAALFNDSNSGFDVLVGLGYTLWNGGCVKQTPILDEYESSVWFPVFVHIHDNAQEGEDLAAPSSSLEYKSSSCLLSLYRVHLCLISYLPGTSYSTLARVRSNSMK